MRFRLKDQAGFTLAEMMVAVGILGVVLYGVVTLMSNIAAGKAALAAKSDAGNQLHHFYERLSSTMRTRAVSRPDFGYSVASCNDPAPASPCLDVYRWRKDGATRIIEKLRFKTMCRALTGKEQGRMTKMGLGGITVAEAVKDGCGTVCPVDQRPMLVVRRWPDWNGAPTAAKDTVFPPVNRFNESVPVVGGFCVTETANEIHAKFTVGYLRNESGWKFLYLNKDFTAPIREDMSRIEFLP